MFEVMVEDSFDAAHCLRGYEGSCENLHGHTYRVQCVLKRDELDDIGLSFDFRSIKKALGGILDELDHAFLNNLSAFSKDNPSAENISKYIYQRMKDDFGSHIIKVTVWETPTSSATYYEEA